MMLTGKIVILYAKVKQIYNRYTWCYWLFPSLKFSLLEVHYTAGQYDFENAMTGYFGKSGWLLNQTFACFALSLYK